MMNLMAGGFCYTKIEGINGLLHTEMISEKENTEDIMIMVTKLEGFAKNDKKNGKEINYYKGRIIKWKGSYENGLMVKTWIKYDEDVATQYDWEKSKKLKVKWKTNKLVPNPKEFFKKKE